MENQNIQSTTFGDLSLKLGHSQCVGMVMLVGPKTQAVRQSLNCFKRRQTFREKRHELSTQPAANVVKLEDIPLVSVSTISADASIVRFLLPNLQYGYELLVEILRPLANELDGLIPYADRIHVVLAKEEPFEAAHTGSVLHPVELLKAQRSLS